MAAPPIAPAMAVQMYETSFRMKAQVDLEDEVAIVVTIKSCFRG